LSVISKDVALAAVMTLAVVITAASIGFGRQVDRPTGSSDPIPGNVPLPEPMPSQSSGGSDSPTTAPSPAGSSVPPTSPGPRRSSAGPVRASATPAPTRTTAPVFTPIAVQAEAASNIRTGTADIVACATCDGGARVGYIAGDAQLLVDVVLPIGGRRVVVVTFESDGPRTLDISANGTRIAHQELTGPGWTTPQTYQIDVTLAAGTVRLGFSDATGPAPDIDLIIVR
jgi:hypothetical protein